MAKYDSSDYLRVLKKVQESEGHIFQVYSISYHGCSAPDDLPDTDYGSLTQTDILVIEASVEKGYLRQWTEKPDWEDPEWIVAKVKLTAIGNDFVNQSSKPLLLRALENITQNIPTILISVLIAVFSAWALKLTGLSQ